jgi:hypothetical protein
MLLPLVALLASLLGFAVILSHAIAPRARWLSPLRRRGIEVHLWGCELLAAGSLLAGVVWALEKNPWPELPLSVRAAAGGAVGCAALYVLGAGATLLAGSDGRRRLLLDLTPRVGRPLPVPFVLLLVLGTLVLSVLVAWSL